jgi:hypothetical protein
MVAGLVCLPLLLAGCGGSSSDDGTAPATATTADRGTGSPPATTADGGASSSIVSSPPNAEADEVGPAGETPASAEAGGVEPCEAVSTTVVGDAFPGVAFGTPKPRQSSRGVNDTRWLGRSCAWASDTVTVKAAVAGPDGFAGGFVCVEPSGGVSKDGPVVIEDLGDRAWWTWEDFNGPNGSLAVCAGELRVDIDVDAPDGVEIDPDAALAGATSIARVLI